MVKYVNCRFNNNFKKLILMKNIYLFTFFLTALIFQYFFKKGEKLPSQGEAILPVRQEFKKNITISEYEDGLVIVYDHRENYLFCVQDKSSMKKIDCKYNLITSR